MRRTGAKPPAYPIRAVSILTGISADALRAWERRYGVVTPRRGERGRVYSDADVARLRLVRQAVSAGHSIGQVAKLSETELRGLVAVHTSGGRPASATDAPRAALNADAFEAALARLDGANIDREFSRLATILPPLPFVRDVLLPALREVGDRWDRQPGGIAHEHLLSSIVRFLLGSYMRLYARREAAANLLFTTLAGERHELGILGAAMLAASSGCRVTYLGPDLPAEEIVLAAKAASAQVVVVGITLTNGGAQRAELQAVVRALPERIALWAGGAGAASHRRVIGSRGRVFDDFDGYLDQLAHLEVRAAKGK